ncbi:T9SS type B sorting domain-containing protein [Winogradskyella pulchriflava]|uniref:Choice-of-anchor L domain-containing protein n=1 Tax=Winogradskyella pulchriflava TaxID=1110688 RepID=A0ABV6QAP7_9FLAO
MMKKKSIFIFLFLFTHICFLYAQQITTDSSQQPNELIQSLVGDDCATASNITSSINGSINNLNTFGTFDRGTSDFPIQNGLILSTGDISSAGNNVIAQNLSQGGIDWETDSDILDVLGIDQTLNATSIEFDFTSANNFIAFKYLFASDEYQQEYPCTFKDVFAILIKRAGTTDPYVNIATVPETATEISTNSVRPTINGFCEALNEDFYQGYNLGHTNYNGNTTVLTAYSDIIPNETYHIKFVIADHIDERFDSSVFISGEGFGSSIDLGPDQFICGSDLTLNAEVNNPAAVYAWFLNNQLIATETNPTLQVTQSGTYTVEVSLPFGGTNCILTDSIEIEIIPFQQAAPIADLSICDTIPSDGFYDFDFHDLKDGEILSELPSVNYNISYHLSLADAENNIDPIIGDYQNTEETETIYVRIESLDGDCLQIGNFNISVYYSPNTYELTAEVCNNTFSDLAYTTLSFFDFAVSNFEFNTTVSYYLTEEDAMSFDNEITEIPDFQNEPEAFYARVVNDFTGCPSIVPIHLVYADQPDIGRYILDSCMSPSYTETIDGETFNYETLPVTYDVFELFDELQAQHPEIEAQLETLVIGVPPLITTSAPSLFIPISIRYVGENCPTLMSIEIHKNLLYNLLESDYQIRRCDDNSNDGIVDVSLSDLSEELKDGFDIDINFYLTEEDRNNQSNPLDINSTLAMAQGQSLYLFSSYDGCTHRSQVTLNIDPGLNLQPVSIDVCGSTDVENNTSNIAIPPLEEQFLSDMTITGPVEFYTNILDAENQENRITDTYNVSGNQQVFYVRMTNIFTGCYDITTMQVNITNSFNVSNPESIIICDADQDLTTTLNLETVLEGISDDVSNINFYFFESFDDALDNINQIENPTTYTTTSREIFLRAEDSTLGCFSIFNFDVSVNADPQLNTISDFINCELDPTDPSGFLFVNKDFEIINGQNDMEVQYYETENDAINKDNPIDKNSMYFANSNPQTIYVRLENVNENSCYKIAPMRIEVKQAPIYNEPNDVYECDINNNGLVSTNLNEKIAEITDGTSQNLNVTFHTTYLNARVSANPLPLNYTSTENPQILYARIENTDSGCFEVSTFFVNALSLPEVTFEHTFVGCAINNDTNIEWDLTSKEIEILDGRQYNIDFTYFTSEADLENNTNPIANPESYVNSSNPETIYVKIRNATTECYTSVQIELIVNMPPQFNDIEAYNICENDDNFVDLSEINEVLLDNTFNVLVSYHTNQADAEANQNALNTDYTYTNTNTTLYARAEYSTTHCYDIYPFQLIVNPLPIVTQPSDLIACDDDFDGFLEFDLSLQNTVILSGQDPYEYSVSYHSSEDNAIENTDALETDHIAFNNEIIFARVENNTTGCFDITQFSIIINPLPSVAIEDQVLCLNDLPLIVSAETENPLDTYLWSTNATTSQIEITDIGTYSVTVTNAFGCEHTSTFNVTPSESAVIDVVETIDFSDPNNITLTVIGIGDYLYQLNDLPFQSSNVFVDVPIGYNTITIIDQNGCARITREVLVIDVPKHMTPNGDGDFDTWHITGVETLPGTIIHIFDRYGKLLKELGYNTPGWDGTFNGNDMPAGDYWYIAKVVQNGERFEIKGHFALRR